MLAITDELEKQGFHDLAHGVGSPSGCRVMILPLSSRRGLEEAQMEEFPTLAAAVGKDGKSFQTKTEIQAEREDKGTDYGILLAKGPLAFKYIEDMGLKDEEDAPENGTVVIFSRYSGIDIEYPPGSKTIIKVTTDSEILGKLERNNG